LGSAAEVNAVCRNVSLVSFDHLALQSIVMKVSELKIIA
jgi:hypothetical protein